MIPEVAGSQLRQPISLNRLPSNSEIPPGKTSFPDASKWSNLTESDIPAGSLTLEF